MNLRNRITPGERAMWTLSAAAILVGAVVDIVHGNLL